MNTINNFSEIEDRLRVKAYKQKVVVVCPNDSHTQSVVERALKREVADIVLVNDKPEQEWNKRLVNIYKERVTTIDAADADAAAVMAVNVVRNGEGDVLMKGSINTDNLLHAVLDKKAGILEQGHVLSHVAVAQIPSYHKLLIFSDAAVIPAPTLPQFEAMLSYDLKVAYALGVKQPSVALINCTEKTNATFPVTLLYKEIKEKAAEGAFAEAIIDGPMDVKTACDAESGDIKGICSPVVGNADILLFPNIQAGNVFYKTVTLFAGASVAGMLCGTTKPVVVSSRADSEESKYHSLVLACGFSLK